MATRKRAPTPEVPAAVPTVVAVVEPPKPLEPPNAPAAEMWLRSILTDREGNFDAGAILTCVVITFMCLNAGYDTMVLHKTFDAEKFGMGIGWVLFGFAAYKGSDVMRPPGFGRGPRIDTPRRAGDGGLDRP